MLVFQDWGMLRGDSKMSAGGQEEGCTGLPWVRTNEAVFIKHLASLRYTSGPSLPLQIHCPLHKYLQIIHHGQAPF